MTRTPIEQATIFLSVGNYRRAAEIMLQIIMQQERRLIDLEKRLPEGERNFTDGLDGSDTGALRTSEMWYANLYPHGEIEIMDPDGWDRQNLTYSWHEELITQQEFRRRLALSTVRTDPNKYCPQCKGPCQRNFCIYCGADFEDCKCK